MLLPVLAIALNLTTVSTVDIPAAGGENSFYVGNRAPLTPSPFRKLPVGAIKPDGWLRKQLELEAAGFIGHLTEISPFLDKHNNAWLSKDGQGQHGWEEVPYWLKGFGDLGYVLRDERVIKEARFWIDHVLDAQEKDGWLGPFANKTGDNAHPDMWPNEIMLYALQSYYEYSNDPRVIEAMTRYFKFQLALPDSSAHFFRGGDNMASVYWLYNRTGDKWLLDLVEKIQRRTENWTDGISSWHGVNFAEGFREPAEYGELNRNPKYVKATDSDYFEMRSRFGQVPGGLYAADEDARPGYTDPRQATETCSMVEMMLSNEMLLANTGDANWAERCEDVTFNSLPASMTPDLKGLHYLTAPNLIFMDNGIKAPELEDAGPMLNYNPYDYRCCQHNVSNGWPYFSENLWFATDGNGLGAALYAPCQVEAKVGSGENFTITEDTNYPFDESIRFKFSSDGKASFPLTLRLPSWCQNPTLTLNGTALPIARKGAYAVVNREWMDGDVLEMNLPMDVQVVKWPANHDAVSIQRGPLSYSLKIGERYVRDGGTNLWPALEVRPTTDWNYGLALDHFEVIKKDMPANGQPFDVDTSPIEIKTDARKIAEWTADKLGLVGLLEPSPALTDMPLETVTLIPMGAARLRISSFPTVTTGPGGHVWSTVTPK